MTTGELYEAAEIPRNEEGNAACETRSSVRKFMRRRGNVNNVPLREEASMWTVLIGEIETCAVLGRD